jgi:predicted outer membrane lipoprotein
VKNKQRILSLINLALSIGGMVAVYLGYTHQISRDTLIGTVLALAFGIMALNLMTPVKAKNKNKTNDETG